MMTQTQGLCESCRELKPTAYTDPVGREYCAQCLITLPVPAVQRIITYLVATIPFQVGDRVQCRTAGVLYDGVGTVREVSISPEHFGTPAHPSFRVEIDEPAYDGVPAEVWYCEKQLRKVQE
jgi:hypothetical protein